MTKIEWTDKSLNHIAGCTKLSAGRKFCYSEKMSVRQAGMEKKRIREGRNDIKPHYSNVITAGRFNGKIHIRADWDRLMKPLEWKKPKMVFVNSMADTFHPDVPDEYIDSLWLMMALCSSIQKYRYPDGEQEPVGEPYGHCFQVLTKRPERMQKYLTERCLSEIIQDATDKLFGEGMGEWHDWVNWNIENHEVLPNVWPGVSVENQKAADERIPFLLRTPAAVRFVSAEPLLDAIEFHKWINLPMNIHGDFPFGHHLIADAGIHKVYLNPQGARSVMVDDESLGIKPGECDDLGLGIDWLIMGAESGPKARPFDMDWARLVKNQCVEAGVPFFLKQRNGWVKREVPKDGSVFCDLTRRFLSYGEAEFYWKRHKSAVDENGKRITKFSMPKLDGQIWDQYPEIWRPK